MDELRPVTNRSKAFGSRLGLFCLACLSAGLALIFPPPRLCGAAG